MSTMIIATPYDSSTVPHYISWGQAIGQALTQFGWVPQTGHGEIVDNGLTGTSYAWSNIVAGPGATSLAAAANYNFKGAFVGGTTYVGGNTANTNNVDVVTSGGLTYVHITASSSLATAPVSDTTNWMPFNFSIFKSNGSLTTGGAPYYIKIAFIQNPTTANTPAYLLGIGKGVDSNGNLTQPFQMTGTTPIAFAKFNGTAAINAANQNNYFSGDADNFRMILWENLTNQTSVPIVFSFDRGYTSSGTQTDAYATINMFLATSTGTSGLQFKNSLGGATFFDPSRWMGCIAHSNANISNMGAICGLPITPLIGYQAAPNLGLVTFGLNDVTDLAIQPVWQFGATHLYLPYKNIANAAAPNGINASSCAGILWE